MPAFLNNSKILSLLKDSKLNPTDSGNYRGISIMSCILKFFESIKVIKYQEKFLTSPNQFGFKQDASTVLCTSTLKEVVANYFSGSSKVYACFFDLSKAFDRVNFLKLFDKLLQTGIPAAIVKVLLDSLSSQNVSVCWNGRISYIFNPTNGVKQCSVASPVFFCVYIDVIFELIEKDGIVCRAGN